MLGKEIQRATMTERTSFIQFWSRVHDTIEYLENRLLVENELLKRSEQLFLFRRRLLSDHEEQWSFLLEDMSDLVITQLGVFIGSHDEETNLFYPSLGLLHVLDITHSHQIIVPQSLIGAFTRGKLLNVTSSMKIRNFSGEFGKDEVFVVMSGEFVLGLASIVPVSSSRGNGFMMKPLIHVGEYLTSEKEHFR